MYKIPSSLKNLMCAFFLFLHSLFAPAQLLSAQVFLIVNHPVYDPGMFCVLNIVVALLHKYEKKEISGLLIDFEKGGLYYDAEKGDNWWDYYFEPLELGKRNVNHIEKYAAPDCILDHFTQTDLSRNRSAYLIHKYVKLKPEIQEHIDYFINTECKPDYLLIGVHYRGTDHYIEAPRVEFGEVTKILKSKLKKMGIKKYQIFVATDQQQFLDYMCLTFPKRVIFQNIPRTSGSEGLHFQTGQSPYECGKGALTDCVLLSKCKLLIRTDSRLSLWSTYLNPSMPAVLINPNYYIPHFAN